MRSFAAPQRGLLLPDRTSASLLLARVTGIALLTALAMIAGVLLTRRWRGATNVPLDTRTIWMTGVVVVFLGFAGRLLLRYQEQQPGRASWAPELLRFVPVAAVLVALGLSHATAAVFAGLVLIAAAGEGINFWIEKHVDLGRQFVGGARLLRTPPVAGNIVQQLVRRLEADGAESLHGFVRVALEPQQRTAVAHVAFCPPLRKQPFCVVELMQGPAGSVRVTHGYVYGARFEIRLVRPANQLASALLRFSASEPAVSTTEPGGNASPT